MKRKRAWLGAAALVTASVVGWSSPDRVAGASGTYQVTSAADGVRITVGAGNAPVTNEPFDLGAPVAQATLDSLDTSQSFAALPYPGDLVVATPGTVAGFSGGKVTPPNYPLVVQASHPVTPEMTLDQPGYRLRATAGPSDATSVATSGLRSDSGAAAAVVATSEARRATDGTLRAAAASEVNGFSAGVLTIGAVRSTADVVAPAAGPPTKRSSLSVSGVKVGDVAVEVTPAGLRLAGSEAPLPPTSPVAQLLTTNGIEVGYLSPVERDLVVVSPAVTVTVTRSVEGPVSPIRITSILGRAVARIATAAESTDAAGGITGLPEPAAPAGGISGPATPLIQPPTPASASGVTSRGVESGTGVQSPATEAAGNVPEATQVTDTTETTDASETASTPNPRGLAGQRVRLAPPEFGTAGAYSLLVVAGLLLLVVTQLYRTITNRRAEVGPA